MNNFSGQRAKPQLGSLLLLRDDWPYHKSTAKSLGLYEFVWSLGRLINGGKGEVLLSDRTKTFQKELKLGKKYQIMTYSLALKHIVSHSNQKILIGMPVMLNEYPKCDKDFIVPSS